VLTTDPGLGVVRHADAGYPEAIAFARQVRSRYRCYSCNLSALLP
jgi:urocanate hydratase